MPLNLIYLIHTQNFFDHLMNLKFVKPPISQVGFDDSRASGVSIMHGNIGLFAWFKRTIIKTKSHRLDKSAIIFYLLSFRYYQTGSPFEYDFIRLLSTKNRELEIAK